MKAERGIPSAAVSVPGSLMLFGEHAALRGEPAIVCAVDRRLRVTARPREDRVVCLQSALGRIRFPVRRIPRNDRFRFALEALRDCELPGDGLTLTIESEFSSTIGLGSSAAVTAAILGAMDVLLGVRLSRQRLFDRTLRAIREVQQGLGSGADAAASLWGGVLLFRNGRVRKLRGDLPLVAAYSGHKTPTPEVIRRVDALCAEHPDLTRRIFRTMGVCSRQAAAALTAGDFPRVGALMDLHHGLHDAIGVNTQGLAGLTFALRADPGIFGVKISGAGLGDCVVGLGRLRGPGPGAQTLRLEADPAGLRIEPSDSPSPRSGGKWGPALAGKDRR